MTQTKIDNMTARIAGRIIDAAKDDILDLRSKIKTAENKFRKNELYMQIDNRQSIIDKLNKRFFA